MTVLVISTLASHERSNNLEQAQNNITEADSLAQSESESAGGQSSTVYFRQTLSIPSAPSSPIPTSFPFPPVTECPLSVAARAPGSDRQPFFSCPNPQSCTPRTPSIPVPQSAVRAVDQEQVQPLSWDNYGETPEFYLAQGEWPGNLRLSSTYLLSSPRDTLASSTDPFHLDTTGSSSELGLEGLRGDSDPVQKIQLVSTDCSELPEYSPTLPDFQRTESFEEEEDFADCSDQAAIMDNSEAGMLVTLGRELEDEMADLVPADMTRGQALHVEGDLSRIWEMKNDLRTRVRELVKPLPPTEESRLKWEKYSKEIVNKVVKHKRDVWDVVERLCPTEVMSAFQRKTLELQELDLKEKKAARLEAETASTKAGCAEARVRLKAFRDEYNELAADLNSDQTLVEDRDDVSITQNMQQLQSWKKTYTKIVSNFREYERLIGMHGEETPGDGELVAATEEFRAVKDSFETTRDAIETADRVRELFSTHKQVGEKLDYPKFSGAAHEDFVKFHDKMVKAFRRNCVGKSDQVEKLRKVLSGFALSLVPESTESIEKAFETLKTAF